MHADLPSAFAEIIAGVSHPGGFQVHGRFDIHPLRLTVAGVGTISLPLLPVQAQDLIRVADPAPYGRGTETLVDPEVRRTWQIDAARVTLGGTRWSEDLAGVVERVRQGLGVQSAIAADLYKLLLYAAGSFFVPHRDTEKAPGMFATLVVVLPGEYSGGELVIRHHGQSVSVDLQCDEPSAAAFAAFYADCVHEVRPVAEGYRLALVYNLLRPGAGPLPMAPDHDHEHRRLANLLADWAAGGAGPEKLVYPLEHAYSEAEIDFARLKGKDAADAGVIMAAAREAGCDLYLTLMSVTESGWADYTGGGRWDDPDLEIGEVTESDWSIHDWHLPDGSRPLMGPLSFDEAELVPPEALDDLDETEPEFSEATGNEGASFERFYQRAALVLWPRAHQAAVLAKGGLAVSVPALLALVRRWEVAQDDAGAALRQEALALATAIRAAWPRDDWSRRDASEAGRAVDLLAAQLRLGDLDGCIDFMNRCSADGAFGPGDVAALALVLGQLPVPAVIGRLTAIIAGNVTRWPGACAELLARCAGCGVISEAGLAGVAPSPPDPAWIAALQEPAEALLAGLPKASATATEPTFPIPSAARTQPLTPAQLADILRACVSIDAGVGSGSAILGTAAVDQFLSQPTRYDPDLLIVPAALLLHEQALGGTEAAVPKAFARLRQAALDHLEARIAEPLAPPADWSRAAEVDCPGPNGEALRDFLASPTASVWHLKAAQAERGRVAEAITRAGCDLDLKTDKRGRPYTLVCTKNQASYWRRVSQREQDLARRARLQA